MIVLANLQCTRLDVPPLDLGRQHALTILTARRPDTLHIASDQPTGSRPNDLFQVG